MWERDLGERWSEGKDERSRSKMNIETKRQRFGVR